jgi:DNA-binding CsgD family transcriptional regulator
MRPDTLNVNYLEICDKASGDSADKSREVAAGIRRVISGDLDEFVIDYPCHSPDEQRWFYMRATRAVGSGPLKVVISHENITALKMAEQRLKERERALKRESARLAEANAALRAVLRQRDEDKEEMEKTLFQNVREAALPSVDRLKQMERDPEKSHLIDSIAACLNDIASPFLRRLSSLESVLTPQEIQVAVLVKEGKTTKDIARTLHLSATTVNFHRRNLRAKLGLTNTAANLRTYLLSLSV